MNNYIKKLSKFSVLEQGIFCILTAMVVINKLFNY